MNEMYDQINYFGEFNRFTMFHLHTEFFDQINHNRLNEWLLILITHELPNELSLRM